MKGRLFSLSVVICVPLSAAGGAGTWDHSFSRGFDLYLSGSDQSGIRLVCDSDTTERQGSFIEVRSEARGTVPEDAHLVVGEFSAPISFESEYSVLFKKLSQDAHAKLTMAFRTAETLKVVSGGTVIAEAIIGSSRPEICP